MFVEMQRKKKEKSRGEGSWITVREGIKTKLVIVTLAELELEFHVLLFVRSSFFFFFQH